MSDDRVTPGEGSSEREEPRATPPNGANGKPEELPIPHIPAVDRQKLIDRQRLRHRRKRYTLFVLRSRRRHQKTQSGSRQRAVWLTIGTFIALMFGITGSIAGAAYSYYQSKALDIAALQRQVVSSDSVRIYDMHGTLLYQLNNDGVKHSITYDQMPKALRDATVAIEDKDFWSNNGIDLNRILTAAAHNYDTGKVQEGASTITQQLIKNTLLNADVTYDRKIKEAILAFGITASGQYSKMQILAMYLNSSPYGPDIYGIDAAAHYYFNYNDDPANNKVAAQSLTLAQSTFLAGIPNNPNQYNPETDQGLKNTLDRQLLVLDAMVKQHLISKTDADAAAKEAAQPNFLNFAPPEENLAPHFVQYVKQQLSDMVDAGQLDLSRSGLSVYTTLDLPLQQQTQKFMTDHLFGNERDDYGGYIRNDNASNSAAMIAQQSTGDIRVMLGSWDYYATKTPFGKPVNGKFNVAVDGLRSVGSTFKAIVYSSAFEMGWFPAMTITDAPTIFPNPGTGQTYKPLNGERDRFDGNITIRQALQHSDNIPAIKTGFFVGQDTLLRNMQRLGIDEYNGTPGPSMAIGALGLHLKDMVQAYATFANYGRKVPLNAIDHIVDAEGNVIYQYAPPRGDQVFTPQISYLLTSVLSDDPSRVAHFGDCSPLRLFTTPKATCKSGNPGLEYPAAAKTGTTDDLADDWAMGYTMDYTGGVWVGNDSEGDTMHNIDGITGAAPIWYKMMLAAEGCTNPGVNQDGCVAPTPFPVPQGVVRATYSSNGVTSTDWFLADNVPVAQGTGNGGPTPCVKINSDATWNYCVAQAAPTPTAGGGTPGAGGNGGGNGGGAGNPNPAPPPITGGGTNEIPTPGAGG